MKNVLSQLHNIINELEESNLVKEANMDWRVLLFVSGVLGIITSLIFNKSNYFITYVF